MSFKEQITEEELSSLNADLQEAHRELKLAGEIPNAFFVKATPRLTNYMLALLHEKLPRPPLPPEYHWPTCLGLLTSHWIQPLLYSLVSELPSEFRPPAFVFNTLRTYHLQSSRRMLLLENELNFALQNLEEAGIKALVLKGAAFARTIYTKPTLRPYGDIDVLVHPDIYVKARETLERAGFSCLERRFEKSKDYFCEERYVSDKTSIMPFHLELHWQMERYSGMSISIDLNDLFKQSITVTTPKITFQTLNPVDSLIFAAMHLTISHCHSMRLLWIMDIKYHAQKLKAPADWRVLQERSRQWHVTIPVQKALNLARIWGGLEIPQPFNDFSSWLQPKESEKKAWINLTSGQESTFDLLKLHQSSASTLTERMKFLFFLIFPSPGIIRQYYPPRYPWLLTLSYLKRWWKWFFRMFPQFRN